MVEKRQDKMRAIQYRKFAAEEQHIEWLVDDLLPNVGWTFLIGAKGMGKTTFALQLCDALQEGKPFLGRKTVQANGLYIQADSPDLEWREMIRIILPQGIGYTIVNVPAKCLSNPSYVSELDDLINDKVKPDFIVWDSLYKLTGVSINTEAILQPIFTMKALSGNRSWMLIHHPPNEELRAAGHHSGSADCSRLWLLMKSRLKIDKGRLTKTKEIKMHREDDDRGGLWVCDDDSSDDDRDFMRAPVL